MISLVAGRTVLRVISYGNSASKGDVRFATFSYNFFFYEVSASEICMSISYYIKELVV